MSPTASKNHKQREVLWQQYHLCLVVAEYQIIGGKHFLLLGPESGRIWKLKKVQYLQKKYRCQSDFPSWKESQVDFFYNFGNLFTTVRLNDQHRVCEWFRRNGKFEQYLETVCQKVISIRAPQYRQHALISDCLDLAHLCLREEAALATNWIKDRPEGLKTSKPCTGHCGRTGDEQFTDNF